MVSSKSYSGETIGNIDETKAKPKNDLEEKPKSPEALSQEEQEEAKGKIEEAKGKDGAQSPILTF